MGVGVNGLRRILYGDAGSRHHASRITHQFACNYDPAKADHFARQNVPAEIPIHAAGWNRMSHPETLIFPNRIHDVQENGIYINEWRDIE
jgi:hypothetical protein